VNKFGDALLGFECVIPEGWEVIPCSWARKAKLASSPTSEKLGELLKANTDTPFLSLSPPQADPAQSVPMIQCTAKSLADVRQIGGPGRIIDLVLEQMQGAYPDFQLIQRQEPYLVAGGIGAYMQAAMSVLNEHGARFSCISEAIVVLAPKYCLIVGCTGPSDEDKRPSADFNAFIRSIRLSSSRV
jgi:hypothetical protein